MERLFKIQERGSTVSREIIGGITTFLAMSYILAVNPGMLGGIEGMNFGGVFTATAVSAAIATLVMAFLANMPVALGSLLDEVVVDVPDKIITILIVFAILKGLPKKLTALYDINDSVESLD